MNLRTDTGRGSVAPERSLALEISERGFLGMTSGMVRVSTSRLGTPAGKRFRFLWDSVAPRPTLHPLTTRKPSRTRQTGKTTEIPLLIRTLERERHETLSGRGRVSSDASSSTLVERVGAGSAEETSECTSQLGS